MKRKDEFSTWKGYPFNDKPFFKCGDETYISRRGIDKGWSGIECCGCGNLIEDCICVLELKLL